MFDFSLLITTFVALFVIIDPIGLTPVFMTMTSGMTPQRRRSISLRACIIGAAILCMFGILGDSVLRFLGISLDAFRVAGGILLFLTALDMLFERRSKRRQDQADAAQADDDVNDDPSIFPLAIPLIAGPGSIATIILLTGQIENDPWLYVSYIGVMLVVVCVVFLMFLAAPTLERLLGDTGILVASRLLGMLLAALSVQFVLDGVAGFMSSGITPLH
ncbi:MAG: MarC family protein [Pseudoruegeria sp.]